MACSLQVDSGRRYGNRGKGVPYRCRFSNRTAAALDPHSRTSRRLEQHQGCQQQKKAAERSFAGDYILSAPVQEHRHRSPAPGGQKEQQQRQDEHEVVEQQIAEPAAACPEFTRHQHQRRQIDLSGADAFEHRHQNADGKSSG